jgi:hypothetical protein
MISKPALCENRKNTCSFREGMHAISASGNYFDKILDRQVGTNKIKVEGKSVL